jgi:hypothetical protein
MWINGVLKCAYLLLNKLVAPSGKAAVLPRRRCHRYELHPAGSWAAIIFLSLRALSR